MVHEEISYQQFSTKFKNIYIFLVTLCLPGVFRQAMRKAGFTYSHAPLAEVLRISW